jgi:hypothetical protein
VGEQRGDTLLKGKLRLLLYNRQSVTHRLMKKKHFILFFLLFLVAHKKKEEIEGTAVAHMH